MRVTTLILAAASLALPGMAVAETLLGLTNSNNIISFDSASPNSIGSTLAITGLAAGTTLVGLDARPANGLLYSVSTTGTVYSLTNTGSAYLATAVSTMTTAPSGSSFGIDFNPTVDRLRLISSSGQNLRINVDTGATTVDGAINGASFTPSITGSAYTNSFAGATTTALYGIDGTSGNLLTTAAPNAGTYTVVGSLGIGTNGLNTVGFDISGQSGVAYLSVGNNNLYTVNLATGAATLTGNIGAGTIRQLTGLAVAGAVPEPATWAMIILGFGLVGMAMRRKSSVVRA